MAKSIHNDTLFRKGALITIRGDVSAPIQAEFKKFQKALGMNLDDTVAVLVLNAAVNPSEKVKHEVAVAKELFALAKKRLGNNKNGAGK